MIPGSLFPLTFATNTILGRPDGPIDVYKGLSTTIPVSTLLSNDTELGGFLPLTITSVSGAYGGTVSLAGGFITFTSTGGIGAPAGFKYTVKNAINNTVTVDVAMNVVSPPPLITNADTYDVVQGEQVLITASSLVSNDTTTFPPITVQGVGGSYGGTVTLNGSNITFTATAQTGQQAGFTYTARDAINNIATGNVFMNITPLPPIEAYIYDSTAAANGFMTSYVPPTMATVFNTWGRFSNDAWYPGGTTPAGEATSWSFNSSTGVITSTVNSSTHIGFVSPDQYENYTLDVSLSSTATDDDIIAVIIAFKRDGAVNRVLTAARHTGGLGNGNWSIINGHSFNVANTVASNVRTVTDPVTGGWAANSPTRVRVQRRGNLVDVYTSPFKSTNFEPTPKMTIDLSASSTTSWAVGPASYGYSCFSQQNSAYTNVAFTGGLDVNYIYDAQTGQVYQYSGGVWTLTGATIANQLGYPRQVTNPETGQVFYIDYNGTVTLVS